ncbi:hypothetical protein GCM10007978_49820 [Shewanella hanedai]|uniref:Uncharacterized protein n=1 Tax=Shewanella hanedai TaxID=25 RepID=A0A553JB40_SHEHA|nr:hypothetical protein [Shewanella hanedai]TRY09675.1 hypothetical protein FN961_25600 [Shewanella hanedai]GGJ06275.1 hypothetical protein GCM10007978_49820 [Shewanella hanedai]
MSQEIHSYVVGECAKLPNLTLEESESLRGKLSMALSTDKLMVSIEVTGEYTCDILVVDFETEDVISSETVDCKSSDEIKVFISHQLNSTQK